MQLVAFVRVLDRPAHKARMRCFMLALLGVEMIVLGYPGQIATDPETRWLWFGLALVPFVIIIGHFFLAMGKDIKAEPEESRSLVKMARLVLVMCWPVHAVIFALQTLGLRTSATFVGIQFAHVIADVAAKVLYAVLIHMAAVSKSEPKAVALPHKLGAGTPPRRATSA